MKFNLDNLVVEHEKLSEEMSNPEVLKDRKKAREVASKKKQIEEAVTLYKEYKVINNALNEAVEIINTSKDQEMIELALMQKEESEEKIEELEEKMKFALLPKDPNDEKNIIVEVRAWTGWDEAALFAGELSRAYINFAEELGYKIEIDEQSEAEWGGIKEIIFEIKWEWAYSKFKYEAWTHRVQRIPITENKWRVHTSAITVAVLPEVDEVDIEIKPEEIEMSFCRASGAWWQHVNKTDSAVHLKHIPTWVAVFCQDGRSQHQNREKAFQILRSKLYAFAEEKRSKEIWDTRLAQVGSWDRSEKIRTYNYPQDRVTDHRIWQNFSWIPIIMSWKLWPIIDALAIADQTQQLEKASRGE